MAKNSLENVSDKARGKKEALKQVMEELELLRGQVGALGEGSGTEGLMDVMMRIDLNLQQAQNNIQNERKFSMFKENTEKAMAEARARIQRLGGGRSRKTAPSKPKEEEKEKQDPKILDSQASKTSLGSRERVNIYNDAESSLQNFLDIIKEYALETDDEEAIKAFQARRDELMELATDPKLTSIEQNKDLQDKCNQFILDLGSLLSKIEARAKALKEKSENQTESSKSTQKQNQEAPQTSHGETSLKHYELAKTHLDEFFAHAKKFNLNVGKKNTDDLNRKLKELSRLTAAGQYENFKNKFNEFNDFLKTLLSQLEERAKTKKTELTEQPRQESQELVKTGKQLAKEQSERDDKYNEHVDNFNLLKRIIKAAGTVDPYLEKVRELQVYMKAAAAAADDPEKSNVFWISINNFNKGFKELLKNLDPNLRDLYYKGEIPAEKPAEKEAVEPVAQKPVAEEKESSFEKERLRIRFFYSILVETEWMRFLDKIPAVPKIKEDIMNQLRQATAGLNNGDEKAYAEHIEQAEKSIKELVGKFQKKYAKEYTGRLSGEETEGLKKDRQEKLDEINFQQDRVDFLEKLINENLDPAEEGQFVPEIQNMKNALAEAAVKFGNEPENLIKEQDNYREKRNFVLSGIIKVLNSIGGDVGAKIKKEFYKKFSHDSLAYQKTSPTTESPAAAPEVVAPAEEEKKPAPASPESTPTPELPPVAPKVTAPEPEEVVVVAETPKQKPAAKLAEEKDILQRYGSTEGMVPVEPAPKRGLWSRFTRRAKKTLDAVFNRETGKAVGKMSYDTLASISGLKIVTDAVRWAATGKGDLAQWWQGRKESKENIESIAAAQKSIEEILEQARNNKSLQEHEKTQKRIEDYKKQLESGNFPPEVKKALTDRLEIIIFDNRDDLAEAKKERDENIRRAMEAYEQRKISGIKVAKDAVNFVLTATGFPIFRGLLYAGLSAVERIRKAKAQHAREETKKEFSYKDVFVDAVVETARALTLRGEKEGSSRKRKAIDFVKALGTVARAVGIGGLAFAGTTVHEVAIDKLLSEIKEQGVAIAVSDNFVNNAHHVLQNAEHMGHLATHPTEVITGSSKLTPAQTPHAIPSAEHAPMAERIPTPGVAAESSLDQFAAEHNLSPEFNHSLDSLVQKYPQLNNPQSLQHILDASRVGSGIHSHHDVIKGSIDTLDEGGGERRQVIFEELLKKGGPDAAAQYLQDQHFSSQHLSHLSGFIRKGTPDEYLKFAKEYNEKDNKMVRGLFGAMQGRESTDLANARFESSAQHIDSHVRGRVDYFGIQDKKPVLSGDGEVRVTETTYSSPAAHQNTGMSTDDKLWANANVIRDIKHAPAYEGSPANAPASELPARDQEMLKEIEADKARFARMGETQIDIADRVHAGKPVGEYINARAKAENVTPAAVDSSAPGEKAISKTETIATYKASRPSAAVETKPAPAATVPAEGTTAVPPVEKPLPEKSAFATEVLPEQETVGQFMREHNTNTKDFVANYDKMMESLTDRFNDKLIVTDDITRDFLQRNIHALHASAGITTENLSSNKQLDPGSLEMMQKMFNAERQFKSNQSGWLKTFGETMFDKNDKAISLALADHKDTATHPIMVNGGHAARIWDADEKKDIFIYDKDAIYNVDKKGRLVAEYTDGTKESFTSKEIIKMSQE